MVSSAPIKLTVIGIASLFLLIVGTLFDVQYLYLMSTALAVLPVTSYLLARYARARFQVERDHPSAVPEGRLVPVCLRVTASGGMPQATVYVSDRLPPELATSDKIRRPAPLDIWDGTGGTRTYTIEPTKRGVYTIGPGRILLSDALGFFQFESMVNAGTELVVHPSPIPARNASSGGEGRQGAREREGSARRGDGMDFHGVREYRYGDALRRVHWPTTARTGTLAVVEFQSAFQQDIVIALDLKRGTVYGEGRDTTLEYAVKAAATLADRTLCVGGGVTLITQSGRATAHPRDTDPEVGRFRIFDLLARVQADSDRSLAEALHEARLPAGTQYSVLTAQEDPHLAGYLSDRIHRGDSVRIFFFSPAAFGGPRAASPAVAGADIVLVHRDDSPWKEGGRALEYLLREPV